MFTAQTAQKWVAVIRDIASFGLGCYVIIHQTITDHVNVDLLLGALGLVGTPGAIAVVQLFRGSGSTQPAITTEPGQSSLPSQSSLPL